MQQQGWETMERVLAVLCHMLICLVIGEFTVRECHMLRQAVAHSNPTSNGSSGCDSASQEISASFGSITVYECNEFTSVLGKLSSRIKTLRILNTLSEKIRMVQSAKICHCYLSLDTIQVRDHRKPLCELSAFCDSVWWWEHGQQFCFAPHLRAACNCVKKTSAATRNVAIIWPVVSWIAWWPYDTWMYTIHSAENAMALRRCRSDLAWIWMSATGLSCEITFACSCWDPNCKNVLDMMLSWESTS